MNPADVISQIVLPVAGVVGPAVAFVATRIDSASSAERMLKMIDLLSKAQAAGAATGAKALRQGLNSTMTNAAVDAATRPQRRDAMAGLAIAYFAAIVGVTLNVTQKDSIAGWTGILIAVIAAAFTWSAELKRRTHELNARQRIQAAIDGTPPPAELTPPGPWRHRRTLTVAAILIVAAFVAGGTLEHGLF